MSGLQLYHGEELVVTTRPHARVLVGPIAVLLLTAALVGVGVAVAPVQYRPLAQQLVAGLGGLVVAVWVLRPIARWATTSTTLTTQRIITRSGIVRQAEHEVPLNRVIDVAMTRTPADYGSGSGTLLLTTINGHRLKLANLPHIKAMRQAVGELAAEVAPQSVAEQWP